MGFGDEPVWAASIDAALAGTGLRLWCGEPADPEEAEGDRLHIRSALRRAVTLDLPDLVGDRRLEGRFFSLCEVSAEGRVVAALAVSCEPETGMFWVDAVYVTPSHRQQGKGRGLIDAALRVYAAFVKESPDSPWEGVGMDPVSAGGRALARRAEAGSRSLAATPGP